MRFATTLRLANRWTKPGLMRSRGSLRAGFRASKAITAMWWGCRWLWFIGYCERKERCRLRRLGLGFLWQIRRLRLFLFLFFFLRFFAFPHRGFEVADAFADSLATSG